MAGYASADELAAWAETRMKSAPDFVIGDDYLRRWWVVPRNEQCNVYLHHIIHSDDDRALHDHPWDNTSMILRGDYVEVTPEGRFFRQAGDMITRSATDAHRLEVLGPEGCVSLFFTGPKVREWGFHCPQGWRHWQEFTAVGDSSKTGRGCA